MLAYLKLKTTNEELYESNFLTELKNKNTKFSKIQYWICYLFFELIVWIKYFANMITIKEIYDSYLFILPFSLTDRKENTIKMKKCIKKIRKLMKKYQIHSLVLSEELKTNSEFQEGNNSVSRKIYLVDGIGLMPYLLKEILEYIVKRQEGEIALEDLYLCVKEVQSFWLENIFYLSGYFRTVNIITPKVSYFQNQVDKIEENVIITVTNNKKKSLKRAKFIVNFDFNEEELKSYTINTKAVLISLKKEVVYKQVGFDGLQVYSFGIDMNSQVKEVFKKYHLLESCSLEALYESIINKKQSFSTIKAKMQKDNIKIVKLYGRRGEIAEKQFGNYSDII